MRLLRLRRFVIRLSLIGKGLTIEFINKRGETIKYNHDAVYYAHKERFDWWQGSWWEEDIYTGSNCMPLFLLTTEFVDKECSCWSCCRDKELMKQV